MEAWMNNPVFKNMEPAKVELIKTVVEKTSGQKKNDLAPIMMSLITGARKQGVSFTPDEFSLILGIFKEGKSQAECNKIDKTVSMIRNLMEKNSGKS